MTSSMNYEIKLSTQFKHEAKRLKKRYHSLDTDLDALVVELRQNPQAGTSLGNGVRKVRMAIASKGKGKSHGARVITATVLISIENSDIILLYIYDKAERDSISNQEIELLLRQNNLK